MQARQQTPVIKPPTRNGVSPSRVFLPVGDWRTYEDFLAARIPAVSPEEWRQRVSQGEVMDATGKSLRPGQAYRHGSLLYYYRSLPPEVPIPFTETILYQDEWLVVADKPHFLPVIPSGRYLQETLLVRLKRRLNIETLSPIHRIDRETAGIVVFSVRPETRARYQTLFLEQQVQKRYEAIAPYRPDIRLPLLYQSRLVQGSESFMQMKTEEGLPNATTEIHLLESRGNLARYALKPLTGRKHQLRVQMASLGLPIRNDRIYPRLLPEEKDEKTRAEAFAAPLQLLAKTLSFEDPVTRQQRHFESRHQLTL
ncbi:MAG: pseudouridine synthase [Burkholderiaceae bacterium]|jgi:tRNA pseudouridine32 synthase/23S rRNA pseudouridine746 synthase|nr:pseudouridine synthase [Burkholderiaceae bacterium]